jgi:hypothetical protein
MNAVFGLLAWQFLVALLAVLLWVASKGRGDVSRDRKGQVLAAWLLLVGAAVGILPLLALQSLFPGAEILIAFAPPVLVLAICARILSGPLRTTTEGASEEDAA